MKSASGVRVGWPTRSRCCRRSITSCTRRCRKSTGMQQNIREVSWMQTLAVDAARLLGHAQVAATSLEHSCRITVGDAQFDAVHEPGVNRILLVLAVVRLDGPAPAVNYERLLRYNYFLREAGGLRVALDGAPGRVVLMLDLAADTADASQLAAVMRDLLPVRNAWIEILRAG